MPHEQTPVHTSDAEQPTVDPKTRQALLRLLAGIPGVVEAVRSAIAGQMFRAVMSEKNAHLFKQAPDGFYKMGLHDGRHFVENVKLKAAPPDYAKCFADLALSITLAAIVAKLDSIQAGIEKIDEKLANMVRQETHGAVAALASAAALTDPNERRQHMLRECFNGEAALSKLVGQLRFHMRAMPSQHTHPLAGLFDDPIAEASNAFAKVEQDMAVFAKGLRELTCAFQELHEPESARVWMRRIAATLEDAALSEAIAKARLVPMPVRGLAAEKRLAMLLPVIKDLKSHSLDNSIPSLRIDFSSTELQA